MACDFYPVVPLLMVFFYAVFEVRADGSIHFTLTYLKEAVVNGQYLDAMLRSLEYAFVSTIVCLIIGYPLAFILAEYGRAPQEFCGRSFSAAHVDEFFDPDVCAFFSDQ